MGMQGSEETASEERGVESDNELKTGEGIRIRRAKRSADFVMQQDHYHRNFELYYLVSGRCRVFLNHTIYHLEAGDMILIEPLALHHTIYGIVGESERIAVHFEGRCLRQIEDVCGKAWLQQILDNPFITVEPGRRNFVEGLFRKLFVEQDTPDLFSEMLRQNYLSELLAFISRCGKEHDILHFADVSRLSEKEKAIQDAASYIYGHYGETLTLEQVAERVHMSPSYFSRRFKKITGFGYKEYVNHIRMKEASRLLLETDLPVTEIAQRCGFSDGNYFGDLFRKEKGVSPRIYRKNPQIL